MENEKKPSRLGVRLSAVMIAVLLVVCMAVPAFASSYGTYPADLPPLPDDGRDWLVFWNTALYILVDVTNVDFFKYSTFAAERNGWYCYATSTSANNRVSVDQYVVQDDSWVLSITDDFVSSIGTAGWKSKIVYCTKWTTFGDTNSHYIFMCPGDEYPVYPLNDIPSGYGYYLSRRPGSEVYYVARFSDPASTYAALDENGVMRIYTDGVLEWRWYYGNISEWLEQESISAWEIVYSSFKIPLRGGGMLYPPADPPIKQVGSALNVVLDWVGATVSALFTGSLSGLLPLVAVPVAITLLIVAIVVIKRSIWGA